MTEFSKTQLAADPILRYFSYSHLPMSLQAVSGAFCALAASVIESVPRNAERTVALRKLLEAKDAAVRASVPEPRERSQSQDAAGEAIDENVRVTGGGHSETPIPFRDDARFGGTERGSNPLDDPLGLKRD